MKPSHYYYRAGETSPGVWQGCAQLAYERHDGNGTHHVRSRRRPCRLTGMTGATVYTLPKYASQAEANAAAQRMARQLWGSSLPAVNDNTDERDVTMTGAKEYGRHG